MRYEHLHRRVMKLQPSTILEVGTWNGERALALLAQAPNAHYYGFDYFDSWVPDVDTMEMNVKKPVALEVVRRKLADYDATLIRGNTRETLADFTPHTPIEFAWIDGGHSIETIASDWANVKRVLAPDAEVWFDDYYSGGPDTTKYGCNQLVETLKHEIWPVRDPVFGGGFTQMVRVYP